MWKYVCKRGDVMWMQDTVGVTVMDAWGQPSSLASMTVHSSPLDAASQAKAERFTQTLQQGSSTGEFLYSTAHLHSRPGTYLYALGPLPSYWATPLLCLFWCSVPCCYVVLCG